MLGGLLFQRSSSTLLLPFISAEYCSVLRSQCGSEAQTAPSFEYRSVLGWTVEDQAVVHPVQCMEGQDLGKLASIELVF